MGAKSKGENVRGGASSRRRSASAALAFLLVPVLALVGPAPGAAAPADVTFVTMLSDPGDYIGGGVARVYHPGNATIEVTGSLEYLTIDVSGGTLGDYFTFDFAAPAGQELAPGLYDRAQRAPFREAGRPGIDIGGDGRGCNQITGRFDVRDLVVASDGTLERLWIVYEQHCEGGLSALFGEIRLDVPGDDTLVTVPGSLWFPDVDVGAAGTVVPVVVAAGVAPVTITGVTVAGPHAADFVIRDDQCSGTTVAADDACLVYLRFQPTVKGPRTATLVVNVGGTSRTVPLDGIAIGGRTRWVMTSDTGDYIGQGRTYDYTPVNARISASGSPRSVGFGVVGDDGNYWTASFAPAQGDILTRGTTYTGAGRFGFQGTAPGMDVSGSGRGCNALTGQFTVTEAKFSNVSGGLEHFAVTFEQHCEGAPPALRGTIEWRVPVGDATPPGPASDLAVSVPEGAGDAQVTWRNPADADYATTIVRYLPGPVPPAIPASGVAAAAGRVQSATFPVEAGRQYTVAVFVVDAAGNLAAPVTTTFVAGTAATTTTTTPPTTAPTTTLPPPGGQDRVVRLAGENRIETAVAISRDRFGAGGAQAAVLARSDEYADALAGTPLAVATLGPLLLTAPDALQATVAAELQRVLPPGRAVYLLGGEQGLSRAVAEAVGALGYRVERVAGDTRFDTAVAVAGVLGHPGTVLLASGTDFPDALAAGAAAANVRGAVLLTAGRATHPSTVSYLAAHPSLRYAVGGPAAAAHPDVTPVFGDTRETTAVAVANRFFSAPASVAVARSDAFADALAGGAHAGAATAPVLLTPSGALHPAVGAHLCSRAAGVGTAYIYGGEAAVASATAAAVGERIAAVGCGG